MINKKFWKPSVTSQFKLCPIPFHLDTYRGCIYGCKYCFARDFIEFTRKGKPQAYLEGNRIDLFEKWIDRTLTKEYDYTKAEEVALKERIPLKIGANSDPFPIIERTEKITYEFLKALHKHDYPVEIQTKNPEILSEYANDFKNPNWIVAVTIISTDEEFVKVCEPNAPSSKKRLEAIKKLTDMNIPVMVKCQPAVYPKILEDLPDLIKGIKEAGCWAFLIQGLKIRVAMPEIEQKRIQEIGDYLGINIREHFKNNGEKIDANWEVKKDKRFEYCGLANKLCKENNIKFFNSDKYLCAGDGLECCGTEKLRDYKIFGRSYRSKVFGHTDHESKELGKCMVNFCRSSKYRGKTIDEAMDEILNEKQTDLKTYKLVRKKWREHKDSPTLTENMGTGGNQVPMIQRAPLKFMNRNQKNIEGDYAFAVDSVNTGGVLRKGILSRLTPTECERLQGFPDGWTGLVSDTQRYKQMGNAVTVNVIEAIGKKLLETYLR